LYFDLELILPLDAPLDTSIGTSIGLVINLILVSILTVASRLMASILGFFFLHRLLSFLFQFVSILLVNTLLSSLLPASLFLSMLRCQSTRLVNRSDLMPSSSRSCDDALLFASPANILLSFLLPIQPSFLRTTRVVLLFLLILLFLWF